jgi:hypothetical protein
LGKDRIRERGFVEVHQPLRLWHREALEDKGIEQSEDSGGRTDAESHHQDNCERESRTLNEHPERIGDIAMQVLQPRGDPHGTRVLARERHVPHAPDARRVCGRRLEASALQALSLHRAMKFHFVRQIAVDPALPQQVRDPPEEFEHCFDASPVTRTATR